MKFAEVINTLMAGGSKAVRRQDWGYSVFVRYSELWNAFDIYAPDGRVMQMSELSLSPGDLFADDWDIVTLDPRTGKVAQ